MQMRSRIARMLFHDQLKPQALEPGLFSAHGEDRKTKSRRVEPHTPSSSIADVEVGGSGHASGHTLDLRSTKLEFFQTSAANAPARKPSRAYSALEDLMHTAQKAHV